MECAYYFHKVSAIGLTPPSSEMSHFVPREVYARLAPVGLRITIHAHRLTTFTHANRVQHDRLCQMRQFNKNSTP